MLLEKKGEKGVRNLFYEFCPQGALRLTCFCKTSANSVESQKHGTP
jgi:hypothetical protein